MLSRRRALMASRVEGEDEMKKWERIADITVEELIQNISIDKDLNGNPFTLKEFDVLVKSTPTEEETGYKITVSPYGKISTGGCTVGNCANIKEVMRYGYCKYERSGFGIIPVLALRSVNGTNSYNNLIHESSCECSVIDDAINATEHCNSVFVGSLGKKVLAPGSRIIINGVRA